MCAGVFDQGCCIARATIHISVCAGNRLHKYSHVLDSTDPFQFKPLPQCPQFHWAVPRPLNSTAVRGFFPHFRKEPSIFNGDSDGPSRNLKAHGGFQGEDPSDYLSTYLFFLGALCVAALWWLYKKSCPNRRRMLFGKLSVVFPSSI